MQGLTVQAGRQAGRQAAREEEISKKEGGIFF